MEAYVNSINVAYEIYGNSGPWITLSHSLGCDQSMWQSQIEAFSGSYRVLTYDLRGHGRSTSTDRPGSLELLAADLTALLDHLEIKNTIFAGISIGGMIGQTIAIQSPSRISALVLANTNCAMPDQVKPHWVARIAQAGEWGVASLAKPSLERWFAPKFRSENPEMIASLEAKFGRTSLSGYIACCEAIMGVSTRNELSKISVPTLVLTGSEDVGAPAEPTKQMAALIPNSNFILIEGAGHLSCIDSPEIFNQSVLRFLSESQCNVK
jgi:3-oxoadipate enol-lactonase